MNRTLSSLLLSLLLLMTVTGCVVQKNPVSGSSRAFGYSWEQELQLGAESDPQIVAQFGLYGDEQVADYVVSIGKEILSHSHMRRENTEQQFRETEFTFRILDSPVINAFALPGGYVYFTRGMMAHLSNEAQFSVVMGHEIGHVAARHASQQAFSQSLGSLAMIGGAVLGQELLGLPGQTLLDLSSTAAQLLFLRYSRDNERESDRLGVEYAAMSGYDAAEGAALFTSLERISEMHQQSIPNFVSTHPDPGERADEIPELAESWREQGYEQSERNTDRYMEIIDGIVFGENPRQGFVENSTFWHPDLEFQFGVPDGWHVLNQPSQVVLLSPDENAVSIFHIDQESGSPRQSVQTLAGQQGITVVEEGSASSDSGLEAYRAVAEAVLEDGTPVGLLIHAVAHDGNIYRFLSYTGLSQFGSYQQAFLQITDSFDDLDDPDILDTQPVRLEVFRADRSGSLSSFLPDNLPMEITPEEVAIINQMELDSEVGQGQWLKIPVQ